MIHHKLKRALKFRKIEFVGATYGLGNSSSFNLPSGLQENDIVIVASYSDDFTVGLPTGYTAGQSGRPWSTGYRWAWKRMGSTPDTQVSGVTGNSSTLYGHIAMVFRNVNKTTTLDVSSPTVTDSDTGMPNCPSITTSNNNAMIVIIGYLDDDAVASSVTAPSTYELAITHQGGFTLMGAYKFKEIAGTDNPAAFGGTGSDDWIGCTIALKSQ